MDIALTMAERLARARTDLRMGVPVLLADGDTRALVAPAETVDADRLAAMRTLGGVNLAITARRAETLKARAYDGDLARIVVPSDAGLDWVRAMADPSADMSHPMKGPFDHVRGGSASLHRAAIALAKSARLLPAAVVAPSGDHADLTTLDLADLAPLFDGAPALGHVISARVPLASAGNVRLCVFRPDDGGEEHYAVEIGNPPRDRPVLARLHSACFTGDILGSLKCDCGPQLRGALDQMGAEGAGILLYLNQEGRGIGLANKLRAYSLQDQGFDTVQANHRLGFEDDERDFRTGAAILRELGFGAVRLMTNNPAKIAMMERCSVAVTERVPLKVGANPLNAAYLDTKAKKSGHML